jgi:hypothetical protein
MSKNAIVIEHVFIDVMLLYFPYSLLFGRNQPVHEGDDTNLEYYITID